MSRLVKFAVPALVLAAASWLYATPYLAVNGMRSAAEARDAERLNGYIDFPAVKENLKSSLNAKIGGDVRASDNPLKAMGAALGAMIINPMVDLFITPEAIADMMKGQKPSLTGKSSGTGQPGAKAETHMGYEGVNRFVVSVRKQGDDGEPVAMVMQRDGLATWKLVALRLPL
ncbi:DUF2939 domain-containing protein [Pseudoduganella ginsengisoli]|uniref:DUF2939 domain-containing protein n=1 Tax=Pseudoduganella ginsengisoli TaxID=1462440 RepID=A0A6L6PZJ7_9BURK|nr:DUF2939 domain-containing protein [Pseudoduganella ginsengisoli]MTW02805.1 DUF2939 domain-containing protein [Pseudoduganella ginsengisoli]